MTRPVRSFPWVQWMTVGYVVGSDKRVNRERSSAVLCSSVS